MEHCGELLKYGISRDVYGKLETYKKLLFKWQKAINLVSRGTLDEFWNRHIVDSLQIVPHLVGNKILDIGSGGGFPGMVLAIAGRFEVTCVDSDSRKMAFLSEVARETNTNVNLVTGRIEEYKTRSFDTICARGFANLKTLVEIAENRTTRAVFLKGARYVEEMEETKQKFSFECEVFPSVTSDSGVILVIEAIHKRV